MIFNGKVVYLIAVIINHSPKLKSECGVIVRLYQVLRTDHESRFIITTDV